MMAPNGRGAFPQAGGRGQGQMNMPAGMGRMPQGRGGAVMPGMGQPDMTEGRQGVPSATLNALSNAPPQNQKQILGEALYPKIQAQQPELAGKITGMLLEMDNTELVAL